MLKKLFIMSIGLLSLVSFVAAQEILPEGNALLEEIDRKMMPEGSESYNSMIQFLG